MGIGFFIGPLEESMIAELDRDEAFHEAELAYIQYSIGNLVFPPSPSVRVQNSHYLKLLNICSSFLNFLFAS